MASPDQEMTGTMDNDGNIEIEATVVEFAPDAMHDNYGAGGFASYDASTIRILAPERLRGRELTIFHDRAAGVGSIWKSVGRRMAFTMKEEYLNGEMVLFTGAAENVRGIGEREDSGDEDRG